MLADSKGLSNVHMQLADPGSGKVIKIGFGSYQSGDTRTLFKNEKMTCRSGDPINLLKRLPSASRNEACMEQRFILNSREMRDTTVAMEQ